MFILITIKFYLLCFLQMHKILKKALSKWFPIDILKCRLKLLIESQTGYTCYKRHIYGGSNLVGSYPVIALKLFAHGF